MVGNKSHEPIAVFGEVLFDRFPDGHQVLGGAPFNVAWHLQAFNRHPCFISRVGRDQKGDQIRQAMLDWGMSVETLQIDPDYPTGTVQVTIDNGEPGYEILADQAYDFIASQPDVGCGFDVIYHGTLALRNRLSEQALSDLIARHRGKVFIDVNLREPWWQKDEVNRWVGNAHWAKLNHDELKHLAPAQNALPETMRLFLAQHRLDVLVVTCGSRGAVAMDRAGEFIEVKPVGDLTIADTVGAGDAFASVLLLGMQYGWTLPLTMERAQSFASALVTQRGATVQDLNFYRPFIEAWNLD
ncbi:MAG: carbohydrate kinase family protein [Methylobacter sp.]